jgi:hypothetical protein
MLLPIAADMRAEYGQAEVAITTANASSSSICRAREQRQYRLTAFNRGSESNHLPVHLEGSLTARHGTNYSRRLGLAATTALLGYRKV